jgi:hypothetical protein
VRENDPAQIFRALDPAEASNGIVVTDEVVDDDVAVVRGGLDVTMVTVDVVEVDDDVVDESVELDVDDVEVEFVVDVVDVDVVVEVDEMVDDVGPVDVVVDDIVLLLVDVIVV